jgi:hypothetical protein
VGALKIQREMKHPLCRITGFYEKVKKVKADVAAVLV